MKRRGMAWGVNLPLFVAAALLVLAGCFGSGDEATVADPAVDFAAEEAAADDSDQAAAPEVAAPPPALSGGMTITSAEEVLSPRDPTRFWWRISGSRDSRWREFPPIPDDRWPFWSDAC